MFLKMLMGEDNKICIELSPVHKWKKGKEGSCRSVGEERRGQFLLRLSRDCFREKRVVNTSNATEMTRRMSSLDLVRRRSWLVLKEQFL